MASPPLGSEAPFPAGSFPLPQSPTDSSYSCGNDSRAGVQPVELHQGDLGYNLWNTFRVVWGRSCGTLSELSLLLVYFWSHIITKRGKKEILVLERELEVFSSQL